MAEITIAILVINLIVLIFFIFQIRKDIREIRRKRIGEDELNTITRAVFRRAERRDIH